MISHDHWDHLDYRVVTELEPRVKRVVTGLGVVEHFEYWGYPVEKIVELDWWDSFDLAILENGQYNKDWSLIHTMPEYLGKEI